MALNIKSKSLLGILGLGLACSKSPEYAPKSPNGAAVANEADAEIQAKEETVNEVSEAYQYVDEARVAAVLQVSLEEKKTVPTQASPQIDSTETSAPRLNMVQTAEVAIGQNFEKQLQANPGALNPGQVQNLSAKALAIVAAAEAQDNAAITEAINEFTGTVVAVQFQNGFGLVALVDDLIQVAMDLAAAAANADVAGILAAVQDLIALII